MKKAIEWLSGFWKTERGLWIMFFLNAIAIPLHISNILAERGNDWIGYSCIVISTFIVPFSAYRLHKLWSKKEK